MAFFFLLLLELLVIDSTRAARDEQKERTKETVVPHDFIRFLGRFIRQRRRKYGITGPCVLGLIQTYFSAMEQYFSLTTFSV
jgi:hypothetical protein